MADAGPNFHVEQQRLKSNIAAQCANIERQKLEILEMVDRKIRHEENIAAARKAIDEMQQQLDGLARTHGELTDMKFQEMSDSLKGE